MIVAGIGCRRNATAEEVRAAFTAALEAHGLSAGAIAAFATSAHKAGEPGLVAAAAALGKPVRPIAHADLAAAPILTHSPRVMAIAGVGCVAEAAAMAAAGPAGRLLAPRIAVGPATCALAEALP